MVSRQSFLTATAAAVPYDTGLGPPQRLKREQRSPIACPSRCLIAHFHGDMLPCSREWQFGRKAGETLDCRSEVRHGSLFYRCLFVVASDRRRGGRSAQAARIQSPGGALE